MTSPAPTRRGVRRRPAPLRAVVVRRTVLSPHLVRVTLGGDDLARFRWPGPAGHLKLMVPDVGATDVVLPEADADGTVAFTPGAMPTMRTYTARSYDATAGELDIDLVLHGDGPASRWAQDVQPGDRVAVSVPRGAGFTQHEDAAWVLLAADLSASPAVASILPTLTVPATVFVEVDDAADCLELGPQVQWLVRGAADPVGALIERAVADFEAPEGRGEVWVAAEAGVIRRIRGDLLTRLAADQITTRGYWRLGDQNHPDHDYGDDAE